MSNFADFNVGTLNLHDKGEITKLTCVNVSTKDSIVSWTDLENIGNKSTSILSNASDDTKYPSVKAIKDYVDSKSTSCFLIFQGESGLSEKIVWSIPEVFLPFYGKIHRITGITDGDILSMKSIDIQLKTYSIDNNNKTQESLVRNIPMSKHSTLQKLWVVNEDVNDLDVSTGQVGGNVISLHNASAKNIDDSNIPMPPYVKFFITIEYQTQF